MKLNKYIAVFAAFFVAAAAFAGDKLAVAEPIVKGGVSAEDGEMLWSVLETCIDSEEYTLVTRSALKQMMTEIGLTTSSDLVNLNSSQKAKLGQLETVKYILISELGKFGTRMNLTMRILDSSTGVIDTARTCNLRCKDLDELAEQLEGAVAKMLSDEKALLRAALLTPVVQQSGTPDYVKRDFNKLLESCLLKKGVRLQNLKSIDKILADNKIDGLEEVEPKTYAKIGRLLEVDYLMLSTISRYEVVAQEIYVKETGASRVNYTGVLEGDVRVIATKDGGVIASIPFEGRLDFRRVDRRLCRDWTMDDYGKYLIKVILADKMVPELLELEELQAVSKKKAQAEE